MKKKSKKATAGERIQMRALAKTLPGHCKGLDHFRTAPQFSVCRQSARATDRAVSREQARCLSVLNDLMQMHSPTSQAYDALWKAYYHMV